MDEAQRDEVSAVQRAPSPRQVNVRVLEIVAGGMP